MTWRPAKYTGIAVLAEKQVFRGHPDGDSELPFLLGWLRGVISLSACWPRDVWPKSTWASSWNLVLCGIGLTGLMAIERSGQTGNQLPLLKADIIQPFSSQRSGWRP